MSRGRLFHAAGQAYEKARSPNLALSTQYSDFCRRRIDITIDTSLPRLAATNERVR